MLTPVLVVLTADPPVLELDQVIRTRRIGGVVANNAALVNKHAYCNLIAILNGSPAAPADLVIGPFP